MNKKYFLTGAVTTIVNLVLNVAVYLLILKDFYNSHPPVSVEFRKQLERQPDQLIVWAMAVTSLAMGFLITTVMKWSGARTLTSGLRYGFIFGFLFWVSVNFGLYASSNFFSQPTVFVDTVCSGTVMTLSGAVAAWLLGIRKTK